MRPGFTSWIKLSFLIIFFISGRNLYAVKESERTDIGGLRFFSQERNTNERTSLTLFDKSKTITDSFSISFDFRIYDPFRFGYIFKIFNNSDEEENTLCHFLCHPEELADTRALLFYINKTHQVVKFFIPMSNREWNNFSLTCNLKSQLIKVTFNDSSVIYKLNLPKKLRVNVIFGQSNKLNSDVAAIDVRNISFKLSGLDQYFWPLNDNNGYHAHEIFKNEDAIVDNPNWLANRHFFWQKIYENKFDQMCGIDFDPYSQEILLVNKDSICYFDVLNNSARVIRYLQERPFSQASHFSIFNPRLKQIISYDFTFLKTNGQKSYSLYLPVSNEWTVPQQVPDRIDNYHHTMFWNPDTTKLIEFGGYAHYRYFKDFRQFDFSTYRWETLHLRGDSICPRTHNCIGKNAANNKYYLYGGLGNEEGDQALGTRVFYDLYQLDLNKKELKKIWEFHNNSKSFIPRANMVISPSDSTFYALCGNSDKEVSHISLYKFSLAHPGYEIVSDSIPVTFENMAGYAFLYYNERLKELYCVTRQTYRSQQSSLVSIYRINFPPSRGFSSNKNLNSRMIPIIVSIALLIFIFISIFFFSIRNKPSSAGSEKEDAFKYGNRELQNPYDNTEKMEPVIDLEPLPVRSIELINRTKANAIWLIGKFHVFDRQGRDITHLFSNKLKNIFYILYLKTFFDKGISSEVLSDMLWPGMDKDRIKNNRGVTFNHLRKIFGDLDSVSIINEAGIWRVDVSDKVYIDLAELYEKQKSSEENIDFITGMYALGNLLQLEKFDEIDSYKVIYENQAIRTLLKFSNDAYRRNDFAKALETAEIVHQNFDPFNEDALLLKLKSLTQLRQHKNALLEYEKFCQRFSQLTNSRFETPFASIIEGIA